ncbi:DUF4292 domain-containing protein [Mesonia maritima]|uniref:DUF4292 domain-containing protein n=1 Tax=Mesonia maritima TaxID=1793873 RepID=A0ABU1K2M1_9FLAO|nr:DUF4292 domain-containing protein [Mesonia maritima]MDR6299855.1 hypothetical protein [Mesonia maritima]
MKRQLVKYIGIIFFTLAVIACGSKKAVTRSIESDADAATLIKKHNASEVDFKTLEARLRGSYVTEEEQQSISVSMRMEKDKVIWLSAKLAGIIPLAKVKITPNRVQYYEKINGTYFDGDFSLLSKWLGTDLDFKKVQNLLIGQAIYNLNAEPYKVENTDQGVRLASKNNSEVAKFILLNPVNFRVKAQQLVREKENQSVTVSYPEYEDFEGKQFPKEINIAVNEKAKNTNITISYRSLSFNEPVSFPFEIPSGYDEMIIE